MQLGRPLGYRRALDLELGDEVELLDPVAAHRLVYQGLVLGAHLDLRHVRLLEPRDAVRERGLDCQVVDRSECLDHARVDHLKERGKEKEGKEFGGKNDTHYESFQNIVLSLL